MTWHLSPWLPRLAWPPPTESGEGHYDVIIRGWERPNISRRATSDGRLVYVSAEGTNELVRIDALTREITDRLLVGPQPHEIECTANGSFVYVPCGDGHWWVVDGRAMAIATRIPTRGRPHNTQISPDQQWMFLAPLRPAREVTVVDLQKHQAVRQIEFTAAPRPGAVSGDGKLLFYNVDGLLGFEVASVETGSLLHRVNHQIEEGRRNVKSRCHGLAIRPGTEIARSSAFRGFYNGLDMCRLIERQRIG